MQNVALAYKQTQAGTTGQDEVLLMLFDGVLRFLAQARDKIEAKDYAAKGILISRALDIINELDSSLNMELGGELAKNLHQLYFLCTTRLLQANLKLDVEKLDSVVEILTGLRSAFAEVVARPEAKAACAQISARNAGKHANVTASRPLTSSGGQMPPGMNQAAQAGQAYGGAQTPVTSARTAAGMYGQQSQGQGAFVSAQTAVQIAAQPMAQAALLATQMVTQNALGGPAPQTSPPATPKHAQAMGHTPPLGLRVPQAAQAYGQAAKPGENAPLSAPLSVPLATPLSAPQGSSPITPQAAPAIAPTAGATPAAPATGGFAGKRLAVYGKPQGS